MSRQFWNEALEGNIVRTFIPVERSETNDTFSYWLGGAGTAYFQINYW